ncbi:MAG TPA: plastocyanin/azurin family copper-binding protein [Dongiaceae bacterium]
MKFPMIAAAFAALLMTPLMAEACEMGHDEAAQSQADPATKQALLQTIAAREVAADIKLFQFQPKAIEVPVGTKVTWTNWDSIGHSVTSGTPEAPDGAFDTGFFKKGESASVTFDKPGEYSFFCARHKNMRGTVKVVP